MILDETAERKIDKRHERRLSSLKTKLFAKTPSDTEKHILNLSDYQLLELKQFILSHDLNFGLPPKSVNEKQIFAEFESLLSPATTSSAASNEQRDTLKTRFLLTFFCDSKIDTRNFVMQKEYFAAINQFRKNIDIVIAKLDEGSGVVILNKYNYIKTMKNILAHQMKFERVGSPVSSCNNTSDIEPLLTAEAFTRNVQS